LKAKAILPYLNNPQSAPVSYGKVNLASQRKVNFAVLRKSSN